MKKLRGTSEIFEHLTTTDGFTPYTTITSPTTACFEWRREQKVTNINSGTAVLREITSQNHWHVASKDIHLFCTESESQARQKGGRGRVRANETGERAS